MGWFTNLSLKFLSVPATKMLILAKIDRLGRVLTVGTNSGQISNSKSTARRAHAT